MFPFQFCGSNDYYWINHGRCFLYEEGDEERTRAGSSGGSKASYIRQVIFFLFNYLLTSSNAL